ncbi:MAG: hypothetical protein AAGH70_06965 [Pseudomonadota bacterium]
MKLPDLKPLVKLALICMAGACLVPIIFFVMYRIDGCSAGSAVDATIRMIAGLADLVGAYDGGGEKTRGVDVTKADEAFAPKC